MTEPMSAAQTAQQNNRTGDGKYTTKTHAESDVALAHAAAGPSNEHVDFDTTFTEFGEFSTISDGETERGMVGYWVVTHADGTTVEVTSQLAVSQDEDGAWWQIYRDAQAVCLPDGRTLMRELGCGNVENVTFPDEDSAWASLQSAKGSLTFEHQNSADAFEVVDEDWYDEA